MGEKQWKRVEKRHAELFGSTRVKTGFPALTRLGSQHGENFPDWVDDFIAGESKSGIDLIPRWLWESADQAVKNERGFSLHGDGNQRIPIVVLHTNGWSYNDDLVIVRSDVFRAVVLPAIHALQKVLTMSWDTESLT